MGRRWHVDRPCNDCPFLRDGGIRLTRDRVKEIARGQLDTQGASFACHKTTGVLGKLPREKDLQCAGGLIFAEKQGAANQITRIMGRLGLYDPDQLRPWHDGEFGSVTEMLATAIDRPRRRKA